MSKLKNVGKFLAVSTVTGLLVAAPLSIPVMGFGKATNESIDYWENLPSELVAEPLPQISKILDKDGKVIAQFYSENRVNIEYKDLSPTMINAIVSIEDTRFFEHGPVDLRGTARALVKTVGGGSTQGGSTLTQQYVKNVLLNNADTEKERQEAVAQTPERKLKEMRLAVGVEQKLSKNEILVNYLNIANFGDGAYGIGAAAQHYFGVPVNKLTLEQAATLAGLVQSPGVYNPRTNPERAKQRRDIVLRRMQETGRITMAQKVAAQNKPLVLKLTNPSNGCMKSEFPFFCQMVKNTLANDKTFGATEESRQKFLYRGGLTIRTTLDPRVQRIVTQTAHDALGPKNQFATSLAVVEPGTGKVVGIGTNRDYGEGEGKTQVNYATSGFQNGSTFKPITLLAAVENGWGIDQKLDAPYYWCAEKPDTGCFKNLSKSSSGIMDSTKALALSSNTFFTRLSVITGTGKVQSMARRLGVGIPEEATGHETSTTLGVYNVSPVDLAGAYAAIAGHGVYCNPHWITDITDSTGTKVKVPPSNCHQEVSPAVADKVAKAMTLVVDGPEQSRSGKNMSIGRPVMGKTGTTNENSAVWFAGGSPQYQMAAWVGDPRGGFKYPVEELTLYGETIHGVFGSTASGPIWKDAMAKIHQGVPVKDFAVSSTISSNRQATVIPEVRGMKVEEAIGTLKASGFITSISNQGVATSDNIAPNTVVEQSPAPGSPLSEDKTVTLKLSNGSTLVKAEG